MEKHTLYKRWQLQDWLHMAVTMCLVVCLGVGGGLFYARDDCRCKKPLLEICGKSSKVCTPGAKGERGKKGDNGTIGPSGPIGNDGRNGDSGQKGKIGKTRYKRRVIMRGEQGEPGPPGFGVPGDIGPRGAMGSKGDSGRKGTDGLRGQRGDHGELGNEGPAGRDGPTGVPGLDGKPGLPGPRGPIGTKGEKGTNIKSCPRDWEKYDGKCYRFSKCTKACSPNDARDLCKGFGGALTSVRSEEENTFISSLAGDTYHRMATVLLGGTDEGTETQWVWQDDTEISYTNWNSGEPNNSGGQNCMVIKRNNNDTWDDVSCTDVRSPYDTGYVCEGSMGK